MSGSTTEQNKSLEIEQDDVCFEHQPNFHVVQDSEDDNFIPHDIYHDYDPTYSESNNRLSPLWYIS